MSEQVLITRAADAALFQRRHGDRRPIRQLFRSSFSLLRFLHHQWRRAGLDG